MVVVGWRGARPWLFLWRCPLICAHTWVSVARLLSIANDVYYKSCSARIGFYKINGARTISLVANPSVSLGKHRALPCERGSGSLHLPLPACSPELWPRAEQLYPKVSPAPSACTAGLSSAPWTVIFAVSATETTSCPGRSAQPEGTGRPFCVHPFVWLQLRAPSLPPQRPQERTNHCAQEPDLCPGCRRSSAHVQ